MNSNINNKLVKDQLKPPEEEEGAMFEGRKPEILEDMMCEMKAGGLMSLRREKSKLQGSIPWQCGAGMFPCPLWPECYFRMYLRLDPLSQL